MIGPSDYAQLATDATELIAVLTEQLAAVTARAQAWRELAEARGAALAIAGAHLRKLMDCSEATYDAAVNEADAWLDSRVPVPPLLADEVREREGKPS